MINRVYGSVSEKDGNKYLTIDKGDSVLKRYDRVFAGIKHHIKKIDDIEVNYNTDYMKIKFLSDDFIPLKKLIYFPTITVIIRCVFKQNGAFYPQVYLPDIKMISYERFDKCDNIDFDKTEKSKECMTCHYWYFSDGFKCQPYVCNGCHDFSMTVQNLNDFFIVTVKNIDYRIYIVGVDKKAAIYLLNNSVLDDKGVI